MSETFSESDAVRVAICVERVSLLRAVRAASRQIVSTSGLPHMRVWRSGCLDLQIVILIYPVHPGALVADSS